MCMQSRDTFDPVQCLYNSHTTITTHILYFQCKALTHLNPCEIAYRTPMPHYIYSTCVQRQVGQLCNLATPSMHFHAYSCHTLVIFNAKPLHIRMAVKMLTNIPCHTSSKECPTWLLQREITRVKFERNCTFLRQGISCRTAPTYLPLRAAPTRRHPLRQQIPQLLKQT